MVRIVKEKQPYLVVIKFTRPASSFKCLIALCISDELFTRKDGALDPPRKPMESFDL